MAGPLLITNGDAAAGKLASAFPEAEILPWRDILHEGPVPQTETLEELSAIRAAWIAETHGLDPAEVRASFAARDARLRACRRGERVALWFEHDLYDQLQLVQILAELREIAPDLALGLVQSDDYLGPMEPERLRALAQQEVAVEPAVSATAVRVWAAFRRPTPEALAAARADCSALPHLGAALARLLAELPDRTGLSLTEERVLRALAHGPRSAREVYAAVSGADAARFLGDWSVFRAIDALSRPPHPLVAGVPPAGIGRDGAGVQGLRLTREGERVLAGTADAAAFRRIDRWVGGTHLTAGSLWRWDREAGRLLEPA